MFAEALPARNEINDESSGPRHRIARLITELNVRRTESSSRSNE